MQNPLAPKTAHIAKRNELIESRVQSTTSEQGNPSRQGQSESYLFEKRYAAMAEKMKKLDLERDYKKYLYFIDGQGNVCHKPKSGEGESKILIEHAVDRDNQFLYFIDKEGDISRSPRGQKKKAA
jgi:hypothetical protein